MLTDSQKLIEISITNFNPISPVNSACLIEYTMVRKRVIGWVVPIAHPYTCQSRVQPIFRQICRLVKMVKISQNHTDKIKIVVYQLPSQQYQFAMFICKSGTL